MAAAPAIVATLFPKWTTTPATRLPPVRSSLTPVPPPPPRLTRRRNYLRRKLLKTLPKPYPSPETQTPPEEQQIAPPEFEFENADAVEEPETSSSVSNAPEFVQISVPKGEGEGLGRVSGITVVKFGACFVGVFVLQAVVRALLRGSGDDRRELGFSGNGGGLGEKIEVRDDGVLYVNEAEMEEKIAEIRVMAKEAKERERRNSENGDLGEDEDGDSDDDDEVEARSGIEREIDSRMTRVRRGLGNSRVMNVNFVNKPKEEDAKKGKGEFSGAKEQDEMLMFEKKYKFRNGDSSKPREKPKGFQGSDRIVRKGSVNGKDNGVPRNGPRVDLESSGDLKREASKIVDGGGVDKTTETSSQFHAPKKESGEDLKKDIEENAEQRRGGKTETSGKHVVPQTNGRSTARRAESSRSKSRGASKEADDSSEPWWLNLPYLLAIGMQQGYEDEVERGFYSLKTVSDDPSQTQASYTVLFEDRADAQNFCHLLESYFEELEDMSVFVVPLPIKELNDAVKSQTKKVIAVRKGQLRLYAGQPLDEVETTLRSLV